MPYVYLINTLTTQVLCTMPSESYMPMLNVELYDRVPLTG
jgi:hypothetical protein